MQIVQVGSSSRLRVAVLTAPASGWDVTDLLPEGSGLAGAIAQARSAGRGTLSTSLMDLAARSDRSITIDWATNTWTDATGDHALVAPISAPEVWAAGVTYKTSREARLEETNQKASFYADVYDADRPELFLKDNAERRTVGPGAPIGIRGDSHLTVPEPEFALVLDRDANIVGITLGNDVTARDIEAANPLYLPQAKIFSSSCALGPAVTIFDEAVAVTDHFDITLTITRGGTEVFAGETNTGQLNRRFSDLARHVSRYNVLADGTVLLTGTGVIPPLDFALRAGDVVQIASAQLGVLENPVKMIDEYPSAAPAPLAGQGVDA